jgi:hypothetical protein
MFVIQSVGKTLELGKSQQTIKKQKKRLSVTPSLLVYSKADEISIYHRGQGLCSSQSICHFWWTKWHMGKRFLWSVFCLINIISLGLQTHIPPSEITIGPLYGTIHRHVLTTSTWITTVLTDMFHAAVLLSFCLRVSYTGNNFFSFSWIQLNWRYCQNMWLYESIIFFELVWKKK